MWTILLVAALAEEPELAVWVQPDYPDDLVLCEATLRVAPNGRVDVIEIRPDTLEIAWRTAFAAGQEAREEAFQAAPRADLLERMFQRTDELKLQCIDEDLLARVQAATAEWRFEPPSAPVAVQIPLHHVPGTVQPVQRMVTPQWKAPESRTCVGRLIVEPPGKLTDVNVVGCSDDAAKQFVDTIKTWTFTDIGRPWEGRVAAVNPLPHRPLKNRGSYRAAPVAAADDGTCVVRAVVSEKGKPKIQRVIGCSGWTAQDAGRTLRRVRFARSPTPWALVWRSEH